MLQWMGGSRRKITTSRKSTQKRQKQYFEQKKRQQQQKDIGLDSYAQETNVDCEQQKENRSLDILSLLNLSNAPQDYKSSCPDSEHLKFVSIEGSGIPHINDLKVKQQSRNFPPTAIADAVSHVMPAEVHEAGSQFCNQAKGLLPMNEVNNHVSNNQKNELGHTKEIIYEPRTSVLDLLGDDPSDRNLEISPANEDHVAFSVNGLGRVGTETPVHSPPEVDRTFSYGCMSPLKHSGWSHMLDKRDRALDDDLDFEANSMMKSFNMPDCWHSLSNSMGIGDLYGNLEANTCTWDNSNHHWRDSSIMTSSGCKGVREASSSSLNHNYSLGGDYRISREKRPFKVDDLCDDFTIYENHELSEHDFDQVRLLKKRVIADAGVRSETLGQDANTALTSCFRETAKLDKITRNNVVQKEHIGVASSWKIQERVQAFRVPAAKSHAPPLQVIVSCDHSALSNHFQL